MATKPLTLKEKYTKEIAPALAKEMKEGNPNAVPHLVKVNINVGLGSFITGKKDYTQVIDNLAAITGQRPVVTKARKAISNFKIKKNQPIGVTVTIRGKKMYDFVTKLVNIVFPRIRDFRGINAKGFDGKGNYTFGIKETMVFPEVNQEAVDKIHGLEVTVVTTATNDLNGYKLLKAIGFPFRDELKPAKTRKKVK